MIRVAVIGAGSHSTVHHGPSLRDYAAHGSIDIELAAVCDLDETKAASYAARFGFARSFASIEQMLGSEKLDAIVAVTPLTATRKIAGELLLHKIPLLIEKPPGQSPEEARELLEIATTSGTGHMISFNRRFVTAVRKAVEWIAKKDERQKPDLIIARMLRHNRLEEDFIVGTGIHLVDTVLSFFAEPGEIVARRSFGSEGARCEATIDFVGGQRGMIVIEPVCGITEESYELIGTGYQIQIDVHRDSVTIHEHGHVVYRYAAPEDSPIHMRSGCYYETEAFLRSVAGEVPYSPTLCDGVVSIETAQRLHRG